MSYKDILPSRLKEAREDAGFSQADVSTRSGLSPGYISMLERGERVASLEVLDQLAKLLGVTLAELFEEKKPKPTYARAAAPLMEFVTEHKLNLKQVDQILKFAKGFIAAKG